MWFHLTNILLHATACILFTHLLQWLVFYSLHTLFIPKRGRVVVKSPRSRTIFKKYFSLMFHIRSRAEYPTLHLRMSTVSGGVGLLAKETGIMDILLNSAYLLPPLAMFEELGILLALRLAFLQGSLPKFFQQDNPAAFHPSVHVRAGLMTPPHKAKMHYNYANFLRDSTRPELATSRYYTALKNTFLWNS